MELLIETALSFPLVILTALLSLALLYWLLVAVGLAPIELFEHDSLRNDHLAGTLLSLGFGGIPVSVALTVLLFFSTLVGFAFELLLLRQIPLGIWRLPLGLVVLWAAVVLATPPSIMACRALQRRFHQVRGICPRALLGQTVIVQGPEDDTDHCQARLAEDPEIVVTLHSKCPPRSAKGERRVLVKYLAHEDSYRSVFEAEYLDARTRLRKLRMVHKHSQNHTAH